MLTDRQQAICRLIIHYQRKNGRAYLYYNNGTQDSLCNSFTKHFGTTEWLQDIKFLTSVRILREELGGVLYYNNQLCGCGTYSRLQPKAKKLRGKGFTDTQWVAQALGQKITDEVPLVVKVNPKFGKRKKLIGAKQAAKEQNKFNNRVFVIEKIDMKIDELKQKRDQIRSRW